MKKIIISILLVSLFIITGCSIKEIKEDLKKVKNKIENVSLMEFDEYKNIDVNKVTSIQYVRLTEAGREEETITDKEEIKGIYNSLKSKKIVEETTKTCDDNTIIYNFNMNDGKTVKVELECDWLVHGNKRYEFK